MTTLSTKRLPSISIVYYAFLLELIGNEGFVIGIDIDIRSHNRELIEQHPIFKRIILIDGSSIDDYIANQIKSLVPSGKKVMICLDNNYTHNYVLRELGLYAP